MHFLEYAPATPYNQQKLIAEIKAVSKEHED